MCSISGSDDGGDVLVMIMVVVETMIMMVMVVMKMVMVVMMPVMNMVITMMMLIVMMRRSVAKILALCAAMLNRNTETVLWRKDKE